MSKIEELIQQYCPDGVEYKTIKETYTRIKGTPITAGKMKEIANEDGDVRIYAGGKTVVNAFEKDIPNANITKVPAVLVQSRGVIDAIYYDKPFTFKNEMWAYTTDNPISVKYLYYVLKNNIQHFRDEASGMGSLPQISLHTTEDFSIPVPPLPVQEEIVRILDKFTTLEAELEAELDCRKRQYEYYRDKLLNKSKSENEYKRVKLGEIGRVCMCKRVLKEQTTNIGDIPFYKIGTFGKEADAFISKELYEDYKSKYSFPKKGDVLISASGTIGRSVIYDGEPAYYQDSNIVWIANDESKALNKWLFYCYKMSPWKVSTGGTISRLYNDNIANAEIPLPPLAVQERIVNVLDNFEQLCNDLGIGLPAEIEARQKQYEYYRNKLLSFTPPEITNNQHITLRIKIEDYIKMMQYVFGYVYVPMSEIAEIGTGSSNTNEELDNGLYPFFVRSQIVRFKNEYEYDETAIITSGDGVGVGKIFHFIEGKYALHQRAYRIHIKDTNVLPKFIYHYMKGTFYDYIMKSAFSSSVTSIRRPMLNNYPIPLPPLSEQERIVAILDKFDALVNDISIGLPAEIEARRKQYEYYRNKLLTFKEKTA